MTRKMRENMSEVFNLAEEPIKDVEVLPPATEDIKAIVSEKNYNEDLNLVRENLRQLIHTGNASLNELNGVASATESPRAYEVFGTLLKSLLEANRDLMDMHKKDKDIRGETRKTVTNNSLYVGTTEDLLKLIKNKKS